MGIKFAPIWYNLNTMHAVSSPVSYRSTGEHWLVAVLLSILLAAALLLAALTGFQLLYAGRIYPGVQVNGIDLGGLTQAQAAEAVARGITYPQTGRILLQYDQRTWLVYPAQVGLYLDSNATAQQAFQVGRQGSLTERLTTRWQSWRSGQNLAPALIFDGRAAFAYLSALAEQIDQAPVEATLGVQGIDVLVNPGQPGRALDISATIERLLAQMYTLQEGIVPLAVTDTQPAILDASAQAEIARAILSQPLQLKLPDEDPDAGPWSFDQATLAGMLNIERVRDETGTETFQVTLNSQTLRAFLDGLAPQVQRFPVSARMIFNDETRQLEVIQPAVIGRNLLVEDSLRSVQEQLAAGNHSVPLVFDYLNPDITDDKTAADLGITELVSSYTSYFRGSSPDRVQNIKIASGEFHGLFIAPGQTFSMASAMREVTLDNGYAEAVIIVGDRSVKGVGGGVCQVSTTLFRTVLYAGLPVNERHAHAYRVGYYEQTSSGHNANLAGLDATVYVPIVDFRFTNDTPYWLLMETYVNPGSSSLTWKFYSTSDGRSVDLQASGITNEVDAPPPLYKENPDLAKGEIKQVDWEAKGADVSVVRTVYKDGAIYFQDTFYTHYQPWQAIFEYGPGTEGIPGTESPPAGAD